MIEDIAERIAAGAPPRVREGFLRAVVPGLGPDLEAVRANPKRIKRCNVRQARRIVGLVDDPALLARIAEHEQRSSVRATLRENPAWQLLPHEHACAHCTANPVLPADDPELLAAVVGPRERRLSIIGTTAVCDEQIVRTLRTLDARLQPELWQLAFRHTLAQSARAHVELAAGRTPLDPGDVPAWDPRNSVRMRALLHEEPNPTPALLELAVLARGVPEHWVVSDDDWWLLLVNHGQAALNGNCVVPINAINRAWSHLTPGARVHALRHARNPYDLETLLASLQDPDIVEARSHDVYSRIVIELLRRFPSLDAGRRTGLVSLLPRRVVGEYLLGRLGMLPQADEIPTVLALYNLGQGRASHRLLIEQAGRQADPCEHLETRRALIDALVARALPRELFAGENRVSEAAHAYTWQHLTTDAAVGAFAALLDEWTGTLPELVEAARVLSR